MVYKNDTVCSHHQAHEGQFEQLHAQLDHVAGEARWAAETALAQAEVAVREQGLALESRVGKAEGALETYLRAAASIDE